MFFTMNEMLYNAQKGCYALGAFEFWSLDSAQAVCEAARILDMPVILQAGALERDFAGGCVNLFKIAEMAVADAGITAALHFDHGESFDDLKNAAESGFTSLMIDASGYEFSENVQRTMEVVEYGHKWGLSVEGELGILAGAEGGIDIEKSMALQTSPEEAFAFVKATGVDALAVAIGTSHGFYTYKPEINIKRLIEIRALVSTPLVLHGGSGTPDDKVLESIENGITKVNICTEFVSAFGRTYIETQNTKGFKYSVPSLFGPSKHAGYGLAYEKIKLFRNGKK